MLLEAGRRNGGARRQLAHSGCVQAAWPPRTAPPERESRCLTRVVSRPASTRRCSTATEARSGGPRRPLIMRLRSQRRAARRQAAAKRARSHKCSPSSAARKSAAAHRFSEARQAAASARRCADGGEKGEHCRCGTASRRRSAAAASALAATRTRASSAKEPPRNAGGGGVPRRRLRKASPASSSCVERGVKR